MTSATRRARRTSRARRIRQPSTMPCACAAMDASRVVAGNRRIEAVDLGRHDRVAECHEAGRGSQQLTGQRLRAGHCPAPRSRMICRRGIPAARARSAASRHRWTRAAAAARGSSTSPCDATVEGTPRSSTAAPRAAAAEQRAGSCEVVTLHRGGPGGQSGSEHGGTARAARRWGRRSGPRAPRPQAPRDRARRPPSWSRRPGRRPAELEQVGTVGDQRAGLGEELRRGLDRLAPDQSSPRSRLPITAARKVTSNSSLTGASRIAATLPPVPRRAPKEERHRDADHQEAGEAEARERRPGAGGRHVGDEAHQHHGRQLDQRGPPDRARPPRPARRAGRRPSPGRRRARPGGWRGARPAAAGRRWPRSPGRHPAVPPPSPQAAARSDAGPARRTEQRLGQQRDAGRGPDGEPPPHGVRRARGRRGARW